MKSISISLLTCLLPLVLSAQEPDTRLSFAKSDVRDVAIFYERLTNKPVFLALDLQALITIETPKPITRTDAIELIRTALLERYGIELRTTDRGETLVAWSKNPKYPRHTEPPMTDVERSALPKGRIRVIKPETTK